MLADMNTLSRRYGCGVSLEILKWFATPNTAAIEIDKNTSRAARDVSASMVRDGLVTVKTYPLPETYGKEYMVPTNTCWELVGFMKGQGLLKS